MVCIDSLTRKVDFKVISKSSWCLGRVWKLSLILAAASCAGDASWEEEDGEEELGQLSQAIMVGSQMDCPSGPNGACTALNVKPLIQSSGSVDFDVWDMRAAGCYDTSMSVVIQASLYNRTTAQALVGRTSQYAQIAGNDNGATPPASTNKYYERLSQSYRWAKQSQAGVPGVTPFHFPEVLNDFTGTKKVFPPGCNPDLYGSCAWNTLVGTDFSGVAGRDFTGETSHVDNAYIKSLMSKGITTMIAFGRYTPTKVVDPGLPGYRITFTRDSQHKVVFNGYQPGTYPLRIHDVGNGQSYNVTVTNDMSAIASYDGATPGQVRKFDFPNGKSQQTFLEYDPSLAGEDGGVYFVDHVDFLSLGLPVDAPGKQVFSGSWGAGWTTLMPFTLNGAACQLAYNSTTGAVHFDQFFANANGANTVWSHTWGAGFTDFIPYYINGAPQFIAYNRVDGQAHFDAFPANLQGPIIRAIRAWPTGLTSIVPFVMNNQNYFLMYNKNTGAVRFDLVNSAGSNSSTVWSGTWGTGFTKFLPYTINDYPYLVAYNATTGAIHYDRIWESLNGVQVKAIENIGAGRALSTLSFAGPGNFLAYTSDGTLRTRRLTLDGGTSGETWSRALLSNATIVAPFTQAGKNYALLYNGVSGAVRSYELTLF